MQALQFRYHSLLLAALILLLFSGCSMVRIGYGQLDTVAGWMAQDYFDLEPPQREQFSRRFGQLHAWHRREQLPEYTQFLAEIRVRAQRGLQAADMLWIFDGFKSRYVLIAARAAPDVADLLAGLTPAQIEHLRRELEAANRKFLRENRTEESVSVRRQQQRRSTLEQIRDWVGPVSDAQEQRITVLLQEVPLTDALRHQDRLRRQREFFALLDGRGAERAAFTQRLRDWMMYWERGRSPELARAFDESWRKRAEFYATVDRMLTGGQRTHLTHRLQDYAEDFRYLAAASPPAAARGE